MALAIAARFFYGVSTIRAASSVSCHTVATSVSGTARASMRRAPLPIASAIAGISDRMSRVDTEPCPLPTIRSGSARNAAAGMSAVAPEIAPTSIQVSGRASSRQLVAIAVIATAVTGPQEIVDDHIDVGGHLAKTRTFTEPHDRVGAEIFARGQPLRIAAGSDNLL